MDKGGTQTNGQKDKEIDDDDERGLYIREMTLIDSVSSKGLRGLSRDTTIQGLKEYIKKNKERLITAICYRNGGIKITKVRKQKWEENNCMYTSNNKLVRLHIRWPEHG